MHPILCCLISTLFISLLPVVLLFVGDGDWMTPDPFATGPTHSTGESGVSLSIYILNLSYFCFVIFIWSSFQYLVLTYILVTYFSTHACLAWNQLSSSISYQLHCCCLEVGMTPHPFPRAHPFHRGGGGVMTMTMAGGVGGGTQEPGTYIGV